MRSVKHLVAPAVGLVAATIVVQTGSPVAALEGNRERVLNAYSRLPLAFVENRGQTDSRVRFYAQASRYAFHFTPDAAVFSFMQDAAGTRGVVLGLRFLGRNPQVVLDGEVLASGEVNSLRGNDPSGWRTGLRRYSHVAYRELWPGVDLVLRGDGGTLKYEFRVRPRARLADIQLAYDGRTVSRWTTRVRS